MKAAGEDVVSFAAGEPDYKTPDTISEAAMAPLHAGFTRYTPTRGIKELREAVANKLARENCVKVSPDQVLVSNGAKQAL